MSFPGMPGSGDPANLRGIVDMGSNGIRFSVSDLSAPSTRCLPTVYQYRNDTSIFDEQYDEDGNKRPLPDSVITDVVAALVRFKIVCKDLRVQDNHIRIIATEATRTLPNSSEFRRRIKEATGLEVEMLAKEDEGRIGAMGIASGFSAMHGLVMDLGGGSTQISWMVAKDGDLVTSPAGSVSFPYGAAALTKRLADVKKGKSKKDAEAAVDALRKEMIQQFQDAYKKLEVPAGMAEEAKRAGGFQLYLSGGGFRGWGYLLMYLDQQGKHAYPISIINGYSVDKARFEDTKRIKEVAEEADIIFRVSDRRRGQVPAVAFLVNVLASAIPHGIQEAHFCQGGVREGVLYSGLSKEIRQQDPLEVATQIVAPPSADAINKLLSAAIPKGKSPSGHRFPETINTHVICALANVMYVHQMMSKETASITAMYSASTGLLSTVHGVSHHDRALLGLLLLSRYDEEDMPPREEAFQGALNRLLSRDEQWWNIYLGKVALLISRLYPSGRVDVEEPRIELAAKWGSDLGKKKNKEGVILVVTVEKRDNDPMRLADALREHANLVEKAGKSKNWWGGKKGWGLKVRLEVVEGDIGRPGLSA